MSCEILIRIHNEAMRRLEGKLLYYTKEVIIPIGLTGPVYINKERLIK